MAERGFVVVVCGILTMSSRCSGGDKNALAWEFGNEICSNEKEDDILGGYFARAYMELMICTTKS
jgi:hypothetical protein